MSECVNTIIIIVGHSGSGKSTLAKALGTHFNCDVLGFSYAGRTLATEDVESDNFRCLNEYIYKCIIATAEKSSLTIVDGVASEQLIRRLAEQEFLLITFFLDTPYEARIKRMMERENCSKQDAINLEHVKALGKSKSGLSMAIQLADKQLDGSKSLDEVIKDAIIFLEEHLSNE